MGVERFVGDRDARNPNVAFDDGNRLLARTIDGKRRLLISPRDPK
jgi:hypothetical protein